MAVVNNNLDALLLVAAGRPQGQEAAAFDPAEFVSEGLETLSLEQLRDFLAKRLDETRADLVSAINRDYQQFVSLSSQLDGMDASLVRLRLPLVEATDKLGDVSAAISARKREVAATLEDDATLAARAAAFAAYCDAQDAVQEANTVSSRACTQQLQRGTLGVALGAAASAAGPSSAALQITRAGGATMTAAISHAAADSSLVSGSAAADDIAAAAAASAAALTGVLSLQRAATLCARARSRLAAAQASLSTLAECSGGATSTSASSTALVAFSSTHTLPAPSTTSTGLVTATSTPSAASGTAAASSDSEAASLRSGLVDLSRSLTASEGSVEGALLTALRSALGDAVDACTSSSSSGISGAAAAPSAAAGAVGHAPPAPIALVTSRVHVLFYGLASLGRCAAIEEAVCARVTRPAFSAMLTPGRVDDGARGSFRGLGRVCDEALASVTGHASPFCAVLLPAARGVPGLDLITAAVWSPFLGVLNAQLPSWSSPALPTVFAANYAAVVVTTFSRLRTWATGHSVLALQQQPTAATAAPAGSSSTGGALQVGAPGQLQLVIASSPSLISAAERLVACPASIALRSSLAPKLSVYAALRTGEWTGRLEGTCTAGSGVGASVGAAITAAGGGFPVAPPPLLPHSAAAAASALAAASSSAAGAAAAAAAAPLRLVYAELTAGIPSDYTSAAAAAVTSAIAAASAATTTAHATTSAPLPLQVEVGCTLWLPPSIALWNVLTAMWTPPALLKPLSPSFISLSTTLIERWGVWATSGVAVGALRWGSGGISQGGAIAPPLQGAAGAAAGSLAADGALLALLDGSTHFNLQQACVALLTGPVGPSGGSCSSDTAPPVSGATINGAGSLTTSTTTTAAASSASHCLPRLPPLPLEWRKGLREAIAAAVAADASSGKAAAAAVAAAAAAASTSQTSTAGAGKLVKGGNSTSVATVAAAAAAVSPSDILSWSEAGSEAYLAAAGDAAALSALVLHVLLPRIAFTLALDRQPAVATATGSGSSSSTSSTSGANSSSTAPPPPHHAQLSPLDAAAAALLSACAPLLCLPAYMHAIVRCGLARALLPGLAGMKAVPATHRLQQQQLGQQAAAAAGGGGAPPSRASAYTTVVVKPLRLALAAATKAGLLPPSSSAATSSSLAAPFLVLGPTLTSTASLILGVGADVSHVLDTSLESILSSLAHMEQSLAWLKKPPPTAPSAAAASASAASSSAAGPAAAALLSDSDRIGAQLLLDVRAMQGEFVDEVVKLTPASGGAESGGGGGFGGVVVAPAAAKTADEMAVRAAASLGIKVEIDRAASGGGSSVRAPSVTDVVASLPGFVSANARLAPFAKFVAGRATTR